MEIKHSKHKNLLNMNMRHVLFSSYVAVTGIMGLIYTFVHLLNHRPLQNVLASLGIALLSGLCYAFSRNKSNYTVARIVFLTFFTFIFIPFSYLTSAGSYSAMPSLVILTIFIISALAVNTWEYFFPGFMIIEMVLLLLSELFFKDFYFRYANETSRIIDITIITTIVCVTVIMTMYFMLKRFDEHHDELYNISVTDPLTGLYNKRYFNEFLEMEFNRSKRLNDPFSIIFMDLDNFKAVNDTLGHLAGDKVLIDIAKIILDSFRNYDICARYGGDEFIVILPSTGIKDVLVLSSRMDSNFQKYSKKYADIGFSVSYGYADSKDKEIKEILDLSDAMLYERKEKRKSERVGE